MYNNAHPVYVPVQLDINGYREKRLQALVAMAEKAAEQAVHSGREILLPALPSSERRLIHLHLQGHAEVTTYSEGVGRSRRLVVRPKNVTEN
jgi:spoIIIJ-associated protein